MIILPPSGSFPPLSPIAISMPTISMLVRMDGLDIREGSRGSLFGCPLGLSIARAIGRPVKVRCDGVQVLGSIFESCPTIPLPQEAQEWLIIHDHFGEGQPLTFLLTVPLSILDDKALRRNEHEWEMARMVQSVGESKSRRKVLCLTLRHRIALALGLQFSTAHGSTLGGSPPLGNQQGGAA